MADGPVDALNRVFRITVKMRCRNQGLQTSFHLHDIGIPNETAESTHTHAEVWMNTIFRPAISNQVQIERLECERLITKEYFAKDYSGVSGSNGQAQTSTFLAAAISVKSNSRERRRNGRMFWPCPGSLQLDVMDNVVLSAFQTAVSATAERYIGNILTHFWRLVIVGSPATSGVIPVPNPPVWTEAVNLRVNPLVTSLRSRKVGVGS